MRARWVSLGLVLAACTLLDQLSKRWAEAYVLPRGIVTLVPGYLDLRCVRNPGAFFSLGAALAAGPRRALLVFSSLVVLVLILALYHRSAPRQGRLRFALALLAAGAIGNLIDRVRVGEVVDFVHAHVGPVLQWATFNAADVFITLGLLLLALDGLLNREGHGPLPPVGDAPAGSLRSD